MRNNQTKPLSWTVVTSQSTPWSVRLIETVSAFASTVIEAARYLEYRNALYRSRCDLSELSDDQLRDVGLSRRQADAEAARPFFET